MAIFGLVLGCMVLLLERFLVICATALGGSFLVVASISELAGYSTRPEFDFDAINEIPNETWAFLGSWVGLFLFGLLIQLLVTAKKRDHTARREEAKDYQKL